MVKSPRFRMLIAIAAILLGLVGMALPVIDFMAFLHAIPTTIPASDYLALFSQSPNFTPSLLSAFLGVVLIATGISALLMRR